MKVRIKHIEYFLPVEIENGKNLLLDNPDWRIDDIEKKTGIQNRYISKNQSTVDMAEIAAKKIIGNIIEPADIDFLIFVTQSPVFPLPTSACVLHNRLGLERKCMSFDINLGCSGFVYALAQAGSLIETGLVKKGLIVCSERYSQYIAKQ